MTIRFSTIFHAGDGQTTDDYHDAIRNSELASNLSKKMTTAKSIPDATAAYQELTSRQMELMTRQARIIFENNQEFMKTCMQVISGGKAGAGG
jgi:hypothetical protein